MAPKIVCLFLLGILPNVFPISVPSVVIPTGSNIGGGSLFSKASNAACEASPTGLLCNTSVATGHKIIQQLLPANATIRHCSVFLASPHCCGQFCLPGDGGTCDDETGACFCKPAGGPPKVCQLLVQSESTTTAGMNSNDLALLNICKQKCLKNPYGCTKASAATDGIVGTVCMCYCDPQ